MKKVKLVLVALFSAFLVSTVSVSASGIIVTDASDLKASESSLREQIAQVVSSIPYEGSAVVSVKFAVDANTGFSVKEVEGSDKALVSKVKAVLSKSSLKVSSPLAGAYIVNIKFVESAELADATSSSLSLRSVIAQSLASVDAAQGASVELHFAVKDNSILVKKVEGADEDLAKSISLALESTKIQESAKLDGNYLTTVKF